MIILTNVDIEYETSISICQFEMMIVLNFFRIIFVAMPNNQFSALDNVKMN